MAVALVTGVLFSSLAVFLPGSHKNGPSLLSLSQPPRLPAFLLSLILVFWGKPLLLSLYY